MSRRGENIYKRKDGLWEARYVKEIDSYGKKKYASVYSRSYREAKAKRQDAMDRILLYQKPTSIRNMTISELVEEWLYINKPRIKLSTYQRYVGFYNNHIKENIGKLQVVYFTPVIARKFASERLESGLSGQTVNSILIFLRSCLKYGNQQYRLPLPEFKYYPSSKKEMRVLTQDEQNRLVTYLKDDMDIYKFGVLVALYTGLRVGELCALRWEDVDNDCIKVRQTMLRLQKEDGHGTEIIVGPPKTRSSQRIIPLLSSLITVMPHFRKKYQDQVYLLGTPALPVVEPRVMQNKFKKYLNDIGVEGATFHSLRHSFATRAIEAGMDVKTLTELLGHAGVQTTLNRYVHSSIEQKRAGVEKLGTLFKW